MMISVSTESYSNNNNNNRSSIYSLKQNRHNAHDCGHSICIYIYIYVCVCHFTFSFSRVWFPLSSFDDNSNNADDDATANSLQLFLTAFNFFHHVFFHMLILKKKTYSIGRKSIH